MEFMKDPEALKIVFVILGGLYSLIEYWLGKTEKVKSGSFLELVFKGFGSLLNYFKKKE